VVAQFDAAAFVHDPEQMALLDPATGIRGGQDVAGLAIPEDCFVRGLPILQTTEGCPPKAPPGLSAAREAVTARLGEAMRSDERPTLRIEAALTTPSSPGPAASVDPLPNALLFDHGEASFEHSACLQCFSDQPGGRLWIFATVAQEEHSWR